jgi:LmbE family N-acetylglucosaminyl deacetylase
MSYKCLLIILFSLAINSLQSQSPERFNSSDIYRSIEKLGVLATVLYVAAHPDDENTRLISHFANEVGANTYYISLTRGDGGQNLIGSEIGELLGVIRTQELLSARRIDGGKQLFSRANDFGFSKNAEETLTIWDREEMEYDLVWTIRKYRPDIIINRFDHRTSGSTHGHHTAASILSYDVFEKAKDPKAFPNQLKYVKPWNPQRLFFNTSWWFYGSQEAFEKADKSNLASINIGTFYPLIGMSNTEIAALSRSQHRCQGFGSMGSRGETFDYIDLLKGNMATEKDKPFGDIDISWTRVKGGESIKELWEKIRNEYDFRKPYQSVPDLLRMLTMVEKIEDEYWREIKTEELKSIIDASLGLFIEGVSNVHTAVPGEELTISFEAIHRLPGEVRLKNIVFLPDGTGELFDEKLELNKGITKKINYQVPASTNYTAPYWLTEAHTLGMYKVENPEWIGLPETPRAIHLQVGLEIEGISYTTHRELVYKYLQPEEGEVYRPFEIVPELSASAATDVLIFADDAPQEFLVSVKAYAPNQTGILKLDLPNDWRVEPQSQNFSIAVKGESQNFKFTIFPPRESSDIEFRPIIEANGKIYDKELIEINYGHIPYQIALMPKNKRFVKLDINKSESKIAYVMGAGDEIPKYLSLIDYHVTMLTPEELSSDKLKKFDVLMFGVRAYNVHGELKHKHKDIMEFMQSGGNVIVQYTVNRGVSTDQIAPYPITLGRGRVTVEEAEMRILNPNHPLLNSPNKITARDFDGWVQERGLYFADSWSDAYTPIFSTNDPGEKELEGALLVAPYGNGNFIYTGISFFRQLPAGVPGAYRLLSNLISLGQKS